MSNVFEDLEDDWGDLVSKSIFKDKSPLDHRFLPDKLVHREEQIRQIAKYWVDVLNNVTPSNVTLYGKTGTGKTAASNLRVSNSWKLLKKRTFSLRSNI